jgi:hypothetical protein
MPIPFPLQPWVHERASILRTFHEHRLPSLNPVSRLIFDKVRRFGIRLYFRLHVGKTPILVELAATLGTHKNRRFPCMKTEAELASETSFYKNYTVDKIPPLPCQKAKSCQRQRAVKMN